MNSTSELLKRSLKAHALDWIVPEWPVAANIGALMTTRNGGTSRAACATMNLGLHVGDESEAVAANRRLLLDVCGAQPLWLNQVHGARVWQGPMGPARTEADAAVMREPGIAASVLVADCLPVLLCDRAGSVVAAAHGGWRGLVAGVLENTIAAMRVDSRDILAWLGPAIGPRAFEVGADVYQAFCSHDARSAACFVEHGSGKWLADLCQLARLRLASVGVTQVYGANECTFNDPARFYSYRRDKMTGRMAALIWMSSAD